MSRNLFDNSDNGSDNDCKPEFSTNEAFAKNYNQLRQRELLQKFKDKNLQDDLSSDYSSESSDSSEEDEIINPQFEKEFLKVFSCIKSKDPTIYNKDTKFFENATEDNSQTMDSQHSQTQPKKQKTTPLTLKDYERKIIVEREGKFEDDTDEEDNNKVEKLQRPASPTVVEEEQNLKAAFKQVLEDEDDSEDEEFGGLFKKRNKSIAEQTIQQNGDIKHDDNEKLQPLKDYWSSEKLASREKFLRDYILNRGYTEVEKYSEIPTYEEIIASNDDAQLEDDKELEKQSEFEQKFNFLNEQVDKEFIKRYPRTIQNSVRRTDDRRKVKRQEIKERKQKEKQQKMNELRMAQKIKLREIEEKINKLKLITGNNDLGFRDEELETDFDPDAHDKRMAEIFNDDYYQVEEGEEKPECPSDIEELQVENWDNYDPNKDYENYIYDDVAGDGSHCEDEDFNMDCEYDPVKAKEQLEKELIENTKGRRRGRRGRKNRFLELIKAEKPVFNPEDEKTYSEYIDEYYKLDCEDIIGGDVPCRFKYVETTPNDFGLTIEEILLAKNKELNQWVSLKKAIQIRPKHVEKKEQKLYQRKAMNLELKRKIFKSLYAEESEEEKEEQEEKEQAKVFGKNGKATKDAKKDNKVIENAKKLENPSTPTNPNAENTTKKKRKRKRSKKTMNTESSSATSNMESNSNGEVTRNTNDQTADDEVPNKKAKVEMELPSKANPEHSPQSKSKQNKQQIVKSKNDKATPPPGHQKNKTSSEKPKEGMKECQTLRAITKKGKHTNKATTLQRNKMPKKKLKANTNTNANANASDGQITNDRLKAYGINPRKFHKRQQYAANK